MAQSRAVGDIGFTVGLHLVATADSPDQFVSRWQAIETVCSHTHRTRFLPGGARTLMVERWSLEPTPSTLPEDLFLLGAFTGAFQAAGAEGIAVDILGPNRYALHWTGFTPRSSRPRPLALDRLPAPLARRLAALAERPEDLMREPEFAEESGLSLRALQRHLSQAGLSWPHLLRAARLRQASGRLLAEAVSLTEIAHDAGFADQAHFTRSFRRAAGMSPSVYRRIAG
jgi:AraC-like DNA-binding protein